MLDLDELKIPKVMRPIADEVVEITDRICADLFDDEVADLARHATARLARKRPSPLARGTRRSWAGGVLYALAQVNFLFDSASELHVTTDELSEAAGVTKGTLSAKAKQIRDTLKMSYHKAEFLRADMIANTSFVWMIEVDGFIVDARHLPVEIQLQAYLKGIIPYIPGPDGRPVNLDA